MAEIHAIHECLFCSQTFGTAAAKDDHVLEHFAQETCADCDRNLIRIGGTLYAKHDASMCSARALKSEWAAELPPPISIPPTQESIQCVTNIACKSIKTEQPNMMEESNELIDFEPLQKLDHQLTSPTNSKKVEHLASSDSEYSLHEILSNVQVKMEEDPPQQNDIAEYHWADKSTEIDQEKRFACRICGQSFKFKQSLQRHQVRKHPTENPNEGGKISDERPKNSNQKDLYKTHNMAENLSKNSKLIPCNFCGKILTRSAMRVHRLKLHNSNGTLFCSRCYRIFSNDADLSAHQAQCMGRATNNFECDICKKVLKRKGDLRKHMKRLHEPNLDKFKCNTCRQIFIQEISLQNHQCKGRPLNTSLSELIPCEVCGKVLTRSALRVHRLKFHNSNGTIFCRSCYRIFSNDDDHNAHEVQCIAKTKFGFECNICKKVFKRKGDLRKHKIKHEPDADKFKCKKCRQYFIQEISLQNHQCKGQLRNAINGELIPCETCGKIVTRGAMRYHRIAYHSTNKTSTCQHCSRIFSCDDNLNAHIDQCKMKKKCEMESPCNICGKIFQSIWNLRRHKIALHSTQDTIVCRSCVKKFRTVEELNAHKPECTLKRKLIKMKCLSKKQRTVE